VNVGDLVFALDDVSNSGELDTGLVLTVIRDVEIPPLIEVLWDSGVISRTYQDELSILCKARDDVV